MCSTNKSMLNSVYLDMEIEFIRIRSMYRWTKFWFTNALSHLIRQLREASFKSKCSTLQTVYFTHTRKICYCALLICYNEALFLASLFWFLWNTLNIGLEQTFLYFPEVGMYYMTSESLDNIFYFVKAFFVRYRLSVASRVIEYRRNYETTFLKQILLCTCYDFCCCEF